MVFGFGDFKQLLVDAFFFKFQKIASLESRFIEDGWFPFQLVLITSSTYNYAFFQAVLNDGVILRKD